MTAPFGARKAKTRPSRLRPRVEAGEEIVITRDGKPAARLIACKPRGKRRFGAPKGSIEIDDGFFFFDPLPEEELAAWEGRRRARSGYGANSNRGAAERWRRLIRADAGHMLNQGRFAEERIMSEGSTATVNVHEAKTHLSRLLARVEAGEEIVIARNGKPAARLVACTPRGKRRPGTLKGKIEIDDSFFDPLPEEELAAWEGR